MHFPPRLGTLDDTLSLLPIFFPPHLLYSCLCKCWLLVKTWQVRIGHVGERWMHFVSTGISVAKGDWARIEVDPCYWTVGLTLWVLKLLSSCVRLLQEKEELPGVAQNDDSEAVGENVWMSAGAVFVNCAVILRQTKFSSLEGFAKRSKWREEEKKGENYTQGTAK